MLLTEYDEERTLKAEYYAGRRAGLEEGIRQGMEQGLRLILESVANGDISIAAAIKMAGRCGVADEAALRARASEMGIELPD